MIKLKPYTTTVLRVGISIIILWFGSQQLLHVNDWLAYLPEWTASLPVSPENLIYLNGIFEIIFGLMMLVGFYTRISAGLLALHMLEIVHVVGYGPTGVRDLAIVISLISICLEGSDDLSIDKLCQR